MADIIKVKFVDKPEQHASWNGTDLIENREMHGGGIHDIIKYICRTYIDTYDINNPKKDDFLELLEQSNYSIGDEKDDFVDFEYHDTFIYNALNSRGISGLMEEARFILSTVYKYYQKKLFATIEDRVIKRLEEDGLLPENEDNPELLAADIVINYYSKIGPYKDLVEYTTEYLKGYFTVKEMYTKDVTMTHAELYIKSGNFSGAKKTKILRSLGGTNTEIMTIKKDWTKIESFLNNKKLDISKFESKIINTCRLNKELKPLFNNNLNKVKSLCRSKKFVEKIANSTFLKKTKTGVYLIDAVLNLKDAYDKDKMMDNLLSGIAYYFDTGPGFAVSAFIVLGNDFWDRKIQEFNEDIVVCCGLDWGLLAAHNYEELTFPEFTHLFLQYKQEKDEQYFNKDIPFTSIRIFDMDLANEIFGFTPSFVNYYGANEPHLVCRTRCGNV